ncbi:MAG TPA: sigma-70 family RNA polymerase sigma factor [Candidatus Limnocylindrales bacterium]|nr:sigma-70 family RNA polymerase sigma factor [Candidatus Limnocylindrales bacterium]
MPVRVAYVRFSQQAAYPDTFTTQPAGVPMLVNLIFRPLTYMSHIPRTGVSLIADGMRAAGAEVIEDIVTIPSSDMETSVTAGALALRERWAEQPPDVVHTLGVVATMAALKAGGSAPIVATFCETPANDQLEQGLARLVDALIPLSQAERERWQRLGIPTLSVGIFPMPMPIPDIDSCATPGGDVVSLSGDDSLDALVTSMPMWRPARLVIGTRLSPDRMAGLYRTAEALGVRDRIDYRPHLRGAARGAMWERASVLVAGVDGSRHGGHVLEAAARGIPSIAVARDAHLDHVVPGTTGILIAPTVDGHGLGQAVASVIGDSFGVRAMGISALVRVRTLHSPLLAGPRLMTMLQEVTTAPQARATGAGRAACAGCPDSCVTCQASSSLDDERRNALAVKHLPLARQLARSYGGRGQSIEDLVQVASLGLVRAAGRFDPSHGSEFHSFAIPTVLGELRRHFRDHAWAVRVPRALQETTLQVQRATEDLRQTLGHNASPAELAEELGLVEDEVRLALRVDGEARSTHSLDHPLGGDETVADLIGEPDPRLDLVELRRDVRAVLRRLPEREQQVLLLRFYGECTQSEIAERLGISQVHVSRVLTRTLTAVREHVLYDVPLPRSWEPADSTLVPSPRSAS